MAAFTAALVAGDRDGARGIATEYLAATASRLTVISDLLHPAQYQIGELWYEGVLGVAEEHRATAIVAAVAAAMPTTPVVNPVRAGARCLLSAVGAEQHVVGLQLLALALEDEGWNVDQLAPPTPGSELMRAVVAWKPDVVGLSAAYMPATREITETVRQVKANGVPVLVGGPLFNRLSGLWRSIGADAHGSDARVATVLMRKFLR